ncbi:MAG TPA: VOC family protein [Terriglobales bacterium]|jgi:catechol 2,3-dioxygenase-like lactoylglutathione lyase family enzyme
MKFAKTFLIALSAAVFAAPSVSIAANKTAPTRPPIVGVAWIGLRTADMDATRKFYTGYLGMQEQPGVKDADNGGLTRVVFKVNDRQFVQVLPELKDPKQNRLIDIAFETTNAEQLRAYLASNDVRVPDKISDMGMGTKGFSITDVENHVVKFVQFKGKSKSKDASPDSRVSMHMIHTGFIVHNRPAEDHLFKDILGFTETWHGGMTDDKTSWIDMRVPDGKDWLEYMMDYDDSDVRISGIMNHLALGVPSVADGYDTVVKRGLNPEKPKIGRDGKWQLNLYGPDQTRVELMEPKPVQTPCCSPMIQ